MKNLTFLFCISILIGTLLVCFGCSKEYENLPLVSEQESDPIMQQSTINVGMFKPCPKCGASYGTCPCPPCPQCDKRTMECDCKRCPTCKEVYEDCVCMVCVDCGREHPRCGCICPNCNGHKHKGTCSTTTPPSPPSTSSCPLCGRSECTGEHYCKNCDDYECSGCQGRCAICKKQNCPGVHTVPDL